MKPTIFPANILRNCQAPMVLSVALGLASLAERGLAVPPPTGVAPIISPAGGFGIDGDVLANAPSANVGDWVTNSATGGGVLSRAGTPLNPTTTFHFLDPYNGNDFIFSGGLKWNDNPNLWSATGGKAGGKTDINNVLLHVATDADGHSWVIIAADRYSTSGDSYIDFEFLQNSLVRSNDNKFYSAGPNSGRTTNDLVLSLAFVNGGSTPDFLAWRWQRNGTGFAYTNVTASLPAGRVFLGASSNNTAVPYGAFGATNYGANAFVEAAVDLTALLAGFDPCTSFGFKTLLVKTKSSASDSASIDDFIDPIQYTLRIGPGANAGPDQARCTEGDETAFPLAGVATPGFSPIASTIWSVVTGTATIDSSNSLVTTAHVFSSSATLRLTAVQSNGCVETDDIVLSVQQPPVCAIAGVTNTCPRTTNTFSAPAGMTSYAWSVSGGGSISGPSNQSTVKIVASATCGTNYTLALNLSSNVCSVFCSSDVVVTDTGAPVLICPSDRILDCPTATTTNVTGVATATDSCSRATVTYSDEVTPGCGASQVIARTWTATDECGNSASCVQTITVRDITAPSITCPSAVTVSCASAVPAPDTGSVTTSDGCSGTVNVTFVSDSISSSNCANRYVITRTYRATDTCGNSATCTQTITVNDTAAPSITCPAAVTVSCANAVPAPDTGSVTTSDGCGGPVNVTFVSDSISSSNCANRYVVTRTYRATDTCGNSATCTQTITVNDTTAPSITCPTAVTVSCASAIPAPDTSSVTASDGCGGTVNVTFASDSITSSNCANRYVVTRTYRATDACGNSATCTQTITVNDTTAPSITCPAPVTVSCASAVPAPNTGSVTASDGCGGAVNVIFVGDSISSSNCANRYVITRTYRATDACGNSATCAQTITVNDTTAPSITCPTAATVSCASAVPAPNTSSVTTSDGCGGAVNVTFVSDSISSSNCANRYVITRTYRATDACGNSATCAQTITVNDTTAPSITCPTSVTVECGASTLPNATGSATATDTCGTSTVTYADSVAPLCGGSRIITRTWTATDACGNKASCTQTITVNDTTPPSLTLPPNRTLNCPGDTRTNNTGVATATDVCSGVTISYSDVVSNSCGITKTIKRTWTATDQCGNSTNGLQTVIVQDTAPTMSCPTVNVQCVGDVPPPYANIAAFRAAGGVANDTCDADLDFVLVSNSVMVGSCPGRITRVYRVTDDCGLTTQCTQTIVVDDTIAPTLTCAPSMTVECGSSLDPAVLGNATATDNCSTNVVITRADSVVNSTYDLNWYASDSDDGTGPYSPTFLHLGPGSLPCPSGGRAIDPLRNAVCFAPNGQLDALTSMGSTPLALGQVVPFQLVIQAGGGPGTEKGVIEVTANWSTYTTSNDRFGYDTNYMVYCAFVDAGDPGSIDPHYNAKVDAFTSRLISSGTSSEQIEGTFRVSGLDSGDRIIVEVWMVLQSAMPDHVGGTISSGLVSARKFSTPPEVISLSTKTIPIGNLNKFEALPPAQPQPPSPPIPPQPPVPPGRTTSIIDRTWAATDDCGNRSTCVQRITVRDTTAPVLTAPANVTLECPADTSTNGTGVATAQDVCGTATVTYSDSVSNLCGVSQIISRTWIATDDSGNSTNAVQTITLRDITPPTLVCKPDRTVTAGRAWNFDAPTVVDACGATTVHVLNTETNITGQNSFVATRTWEANDACGNSSACQQTVTVVTPPPPVISAQPQGTTVVAGNSLTLSVTASGAGVLSYQWQKDGNDLPGATGNSLTLTAAQFPNAGLYCVRVSNLGGTALSSIAVVNVTTALTTQKTGNILIFTWSAPYILQSAPTVAGPYADVPGAVSPYVYDASGPQLYFRLRLPTFPLQASRLANGQFSISGAGVQGCNFVMQASTNLIHWVNMETNPSPFNCVDSNAAQYPRRFYRVVPAN